MGNTRPYLVLLAALAASCLFVHMPSGAEGQDARSLYTQGVKLFGKGDFVEASQAFRAANQIKPSWKLFYNIGQSEAAAGRYGLALEAFEAYLVQGADQVPEDRGESVLREVQRLRVLVGTINVEAPNGTALEVDEMPRGVTPFKGPVRVAAGMHRVVLRVDDKMVLDKQISVAGGMTTDVKLSEQPVTTPAKPAAADGPAPAEPGDEERVLEADVNSPPQTAGPGAGEKKGLSPIPFYVMLGVTGALGAGTITMEALVLGKKKDIEKNPADGDARDRGKSLQTGEWVLLGLTGAAAVAAVVLAFLTDFDGESNEANPSDTTSVVPIITQDGAGFGLVGRF